MLDRPSAERRPLHHVHNILVKLRDGLRNKHLARAAASRFTNHKRKGPRARTVAGGSFFMPAPAAHRFRPLILMVAVWLWRLLLLLCSCRAVRRNSATVLCPGLSSRGGRQIFFN